MTDKQLAEIAYQGLVLPIREKFTPQECEGLAQLAQKASAQEELLQARNKRYQTACIDTNNEASYEEEEVALAEWARNRKTVMCPWVTEKADEKKYDFDITKADKIFDLLLQEKQIQIPLNHRLPSPEELKTIKWCKWHNSQSHHTNDCKIFRQ